MQTRIFNNLVGLQRQMLKLIGEVNSLSNPLALEDAIDEAWHPRCDVFETESQWVVVVELAGMEKDEISITMSDEFLRISGVRSFPSKKNLSYYNMEIETGKFVRLIYFPETALDRDNPKVSYINGILRIAFDLAPIIERVIPVQ